MHYDASLLPLLLLVFLSLHKAPKITQTTVGNQKRHTGLPIVVLM